MNNKKGILLKSMMIGSLIGGIVSLFHKETRENASRCAREASSKTMTFAKTVKNDPSRVKHQIQATSENVKTIVNDIKSETQDVIDTFNEVKANSIKTYQSMKETGGELKELGSQLKDSTEQVKGNRE